MVLPVLGGLLVADEVIDLFLPVLFYRVRLGRCVIVVPSCQLVEGSSPEGAYA